MSLNLSHSPVLCNKISTKDAADLTACPKNIFRTSSEMVYCIPYRNLWTVPGLGSFRKSSSVCLFRVNNDEGRSSKLNVGGTMRQVPTNAQQETDDQAEEVAHRILPAQLLLILEYIPRAV